MKNTRYKLGILAAVIVALTACQNESKNKGQPVPEPPPPANVTGISLEDMDLTIFGSRRITPAFEPSNASNKRVTWSSDNPEVVSVDENGVITALKFSDTATYTGQAVITVTSDDGGFTDTCVVTVTMAAQEHITDLPPLKDLFADYFMMGNIFDPPNWWGSGDISATEPYTITKPYLTLHYNILTHQNNMKPSYLSGAARGTYNENNIKTAKNMIAAASASGIKILGHCLLWHDQIPTWQGNLRTSADSKEDVLEWLKEYITYIVEEFKDCDIYAWDVLNEVFPDGVSAASDWTKVMRGLTSSINNQNQTVYAGNPWYIKLGADFVYEGFLAARLADPRIILYYNDYNLDQAGKATMVRNMVKAVNDKYLASDDKPAGEAPDRLLIEGIGMQSHHNLGVTAKAIEDTLKLFKPLGVKISISELDLIAHQNYSEYNGGTVAVTNAALLAQAERYGQYFKVFLDYSDIIERVTFWGNSDSNNWRSQALDRNDPNGPWRGLPTLFDREFKAKPAYYKIIEALKQKLAE